MRSIAERILDECDDAVIFADRRGIIRMFNAGAERMFGHSAEQVMGKSLDLIIPEKNRAQHWHGYHRVMKTGVTSYAGSLLSVPALRADGTRMSVDFTVTLLCNEDDRVEGVAAILRDVTDRRAEDQAVRRALAELRALMDRP
jgi:PAS domain S-box-containing protein